MLEKTDDCKTVESLFCSTLTILVIVRLLRNVNKFGDFKTKATSTPFCLSLMS
jgi:hypothetical protein